LTGRRQFDAHWSDDVEICPCPPERTLLVVAGGPGNSFVSHSWQGGVHGAVPISTAFEASPTCEV
jgi:hypothetical protein